MTAVYLEVGTRRVFACALDWPGWARSGRTEEAAIEALVSYAARYAPVAADAGHPLPRRAADAVDVVERLRGGATTDFGAPEAVAAPDATPLRPAQAGRAADLVEACWRALDAAAAVAPQSLRKGPRGGGRDRDAVVAHVLAAEAAYGRKLGIKHPAPELGDTAAVAALRADLVAALRAARGAEPAVARGWPPRYAARRIGWHALDHAWEIEDRSEPA